MLAPELPGAENAPDLWLYGTIAHSVVRDILLYVDAIGATILDHNEARFAVRVIHLWVAQLTFFDDA